MIGKLIKNEFKAGLHFMGPIYIVATVIAALLFYSLSKSAQTENVQQAAILIILVGLVGFGVFVGTIITVITNFNKSMFRDQGYLTFTLPVKSSQLIFAKAFSSFFWILFSYIINVALLVGAFLSMVSQFIDKDEFKTIENSTDKILTFISSFTDGELPWSSFQEILAALISIFIFLVVYIFISTLHTVSQIYFSVSLSNIRPFQKLGMYSTIGIYFFVWFVSSIISTVLNMSFPFYLEIGLFGVRAVSEALIISDPASFSFGVGNIVYPVISSVFFFFMTSWFIKHKINLK